MVQWLGILALTAKGPGLIPGQVTKILRAARGMAKKKKKERERENANRLQKTEKMSKLDRQSESKIEKSRTMIPKAKKILDKYCRQVLLPTATGFNVLTEVV